MEVVLDLPVHERQLREFCLDGNPLCPKAAAELAAVQNIVRPNFAPAIGCQVQPWRWSVAGNAPK